MRGTRSFVLNCLAVALAMIVARADAQTTAPARQLGPPLTINPAPGWVLAERAVAERAFNTRMESWVSEVLHPAGSRMSDLPYALIDVEEWPTIGLPSGAQQRAIADAVANYFRTPLLPPSKADRSPSWKRAKLSPIDYDPANNRFTFDATITYDFVGDLHVQVRGLINPTGMFVLAVWSDDAYFDKHAAELRAMRDSFGFSAGGLNPIESAKQSFLSKTRWLVGFLVVALIVAQAVIFARDRRQRREERERLLESIREP